MKHLKIRCSSLSKILGNGRGPYGLTQTAMTEVESIVKQELYKYTVDINSKYLDKGTECEDQAIELYNEFFFTSYVKNSERKENDWITGECDIDTGSKIIDVKCPWDSSKHPATKSEAVAKSKKAGYPEQLMGYMWLWGRDSGEIAYCLVDTPEHLIEWEKNRSPHEVEHLPINLRITVDSYERDPEFEMLVIEKVEACRKYASDYLEQINKKHENDYKQ